LTGEESVDPSTVFIFMYSRYLQQLDSCIYNESVVVLLYPLTAL
jgi:hypothetical protein